VALTVGSLFSGIGGFDLGLERAGMKVIWQLEKDPFCLEILKKHWPDVKKYKDIREVDLNELEPVDVLCGGPPCQPFSVAGKRKGKGDDRYLWPEMFQVIKTLRPRWVIVENVTGIVNMALEDICTDLETEDYEVQAFIIPACSVNAPHRRDRIWIIAHRNSERQLQQEGTLEEQRRRIGDNNKQNAADSDNSRSRTSRDGDNREWQEKNKGQERFSQHESSGYNEAASNSESKSGESDVQRCNRAAEQEQLGRNTIKSVVDRGSDIPTDSERWGIPWLPIAASLCRVDDGLPRRMDRAKRLKALGNAVVPQIVEIIGRAIMKIEKHHKSHNERQVKPPLLAAWFPDELPGKIKAQ